MITQRNSRRTPTGAKYKKARDKRLYEMGSEPTHTKLGEKLLKKSRTKGANIKVKTLRSDVANVFDTKTKTFKKAKIKTVVDNSASKHFVRRNIITKGTVIDTELGKAKVTSRPGQDGTINATLIL